MSTQAEPGNTHAKRGNTAGETGVGYTGGEGLEFCLETRDRDSLTGFVVQQELHILQVHCGYAE